MRVLRFPMQVTGIARMCALLVWHFAWIEHTSQNKYLEYLQFNTRLSHYIKCIHIKGMCWGAMLQQNIYFYVSKHILVNNYTLATVLSFTLAMCVTLRRVDGINDNIFLFSPCHHSRACHSCCFFTVALQVVYSVAC